MKAIRFPFNIFPLKLKVCSNDEVTKEMKLSPSAFIAIKITAIKIVNGKTYIAWFRSYFN